MAKYSKAARKGVESAMKRAKKGTVRSGRGRKKVKDPTQAIAIGLSEARKKGAKVPRKKTAVKKKAAVKKKTASTNSSRTAARKTAPKKQVSAKKKPSGKTTAAKHRTKSPEPIKTNLRSASAEMEQPVAPNNVQTGLLMKEETAQPKPFDSFMSGTGHVRQMPVSSKAKTRTKPAGKKPLWN